MADIKIDIIARDKSQQALGKLNNNLTKTKSSVFNLKNALIAIGSSIVVKQFFNLSNEFQNLQNRLKLVTNSTLELNKVQSELFEIARRTRGGFSETVELYQKLALQSKNLGLSSKELATITENVNKVIGIAGVGSIQASSGILQLSQAFASGRLQGDEFRSISENIPPLLDIFAKELGVTRGELKKLGSEGKITSDIIATALLKETDNINKKFQQLSPTIGQATTRLGNSFLNLAGTFNEATGLANKLARGIISISDSLDNLSKKIKDSTPSLEDLKKQLEDIDKTVIDLGGNLDKVDPLGVLANDIKELNKADLKQAIKNLDIYNDRLMLIAKGQVDFAGQFLELNRQQKNVIKTYKFYEDAIIRTKGNVINQKDALEEVLEKIKKSNDEYSLSNELFTGINNATSKFSQSLAESLVLGKSLNKNFRELAQSLLVDIVAKTIERITLKLVEKTIDEFLLNREKEKVDAINHQNSSLKKQIALQAILMAMGGGGGGSSLKFFANGGTVSKGKPIMVGERGPELFVPNQTGQITQNARGTNSGQTTVNFNINTVDASGFEELLVRSRGTITQLINSAVNERGARSII